jgi:RimJ/RimL family protein N-acetyltransferase
VSSKFPTLAIIAWLGESYGWRSRREGMTALRFPRLTPRLLLRPLVRDDRDAIHYLYRDWAVARWLSRLPWPFTPESAETLIAEAALDLERGRGWFLAVTHRTTGAFVGTLILRLPSFDVDPWTHDKRLGVLGYAIARERQGNGYASEAAASMVELAFTDLYVLRLRATVLRDNVASRRVLERLHFRVWHASVREVPRYGGPPRLGDTFVLDRADWIAANRASVTRADAPRPPT